MKRAMTPTMSPTTIHTGMVLISTRFAPFWDLSRQKTGSAAWGAPAMPRIEFRYSGRAWHGACGARRAARLVCSAWHRVLALPRREPPREEQRHAQERSRDPHGDPADPIRRRRAYRDVQRQLGDRGTHGVQRIHGRAA